MNKNSLISTIADYQRLSNFQEAIVDLGELSIGKISVESFFKVVSSRIAQILPADFVSIMTVEDGERLVLTAGAGWNESQLGSTLAEWKTDSDDEYPTVLRGPVVDADLSVPPLIGALIPSGVTGINSAQSVPISYRSDAYRRGQWNRYEAHVG